MTWTAQQIELSKLPVQSRFDLLPPHLKAIIERAKILGLQPKKIWLYGSRARGDARTNSDFDLAFQITDNNRWSEFVVLVADDPPSLYRYDLVDIETVNEDLRQAICHQGVLIYER